MQVQDRGTNTGHSGGSHPADRRPQHRRPPCPLTPPASPASGAHRPGVGIVHLGLGAFFRAHGAIYVAEAMAASGGDWGIVGVSLVQPDPARPARPAGLRLHRRSSSAPTARPRASSRSVQNVLVAREDPEAVLAAMADPGVRIVSLTVTEKGYCHEPSTGRLNRDHPDIVHDLAHPDAPRSAPGFLVARARPPPRRGPAPFTVLCCDNLPENGRVVRGVTLELARADRPRPRRLDRGRGRLPLHDGRPHRARDQARGHRRG